MNQTTGAEWTRWDLDCFYSEIGDNALDADINRFSELAIRFNATHKGRLGQTLEQAVVDYSEIYSLEYKIMMYLFLKQTEDVANPEVKARIAKVSRLLSQASGEHLTFFQIELANLNDDDLRDWYGRSDLVAKHRPYIEYVRLFKPHMLIEPVEGALTKRSPFGSGAWGEFFDELEADLSFKYKGEEKTLTEMTHLLSEHKDARERFAVMTAINDGFKGPFAKYSAQTLYMVTGSGAVEQRERSYKHPMDAVNKSNKVSDEVVNALHGAVENEAAPLAQRYYHLKAAHLGMKTLRWSDRNAPMPFTDTTRVSFDEAMRITLEAYESFSPTLASLIRDMKDQKRIDAPAVKGKRGGAFNYSAVLPSGVPVSFTMLNYLGSNRDVMTLAHELGHGVHGLLAGREQGTLMFHAPITYCETASVFGEITTFNFLKDQLAKKGDRESLLALIMAKIDDVINTAVRQIGFSNFERRIHGMDEDYRDWHEPEKLSPEQLSKIWLETLKQLYGEDGGVFTYENTELLWSYVGHFHRPFYVYGYAFGQLLTHSLYAKQSEFGERFEPLYLDMLKSGSTRNVTELLRPFGLDPSDENFWTNGIKVGLGRMVQEAEELSHEMGIVINRI